VNSDLNKYRRIDGGKPGCNAPPSQQCFPNGVVAPTRSAEDIKDIKNLTAEGQSDERWQFGAIAVGSAFAIAGGYFLYKGYLAGSGDETSTASRGLRIFPTATASTGGIVTEFDF
jgi:hypothetical protein